MSSAISALASVSDALFNTKVFPEGSAQLEGLLWATLPGIDATDVMKTMNTLHFHLASGRERTSPDAALGCVQAFLLNVPLVPWSPARGSDDNEATAAARSATLCFPEWGAAFMERLVGGTVLPAHALRCAAWCAAAAD